MNQNPICFLFLEKQPKAQFLYNEVQNYVQ